MAKGNLINKLFASGPLFLLYYLSVSEVDTNLEKLFEVFSLNLQIIIMTQKLTIINCLVVTVSFHIQFLKI